VFSLFLIPEDFHKGFYVGVFFEVAKELQ